jgi:GR25 family glycosyltransferase involved in LPS biosynthesis
VILARNIPVQTESFFFNTFIREKKYFNYKNVLSAPCPVSLNQNAAFGSIIISLSNSSDSNKKEYFLRQKFLRNKFYAKTPPQITK